MALHLNVKIEMFWLSWTRHLSPTFDQCFAYVSIKASEMWSENNLIDLKDFVPHVYNVIGKKNTFWGFLLNNIDWKT